MYDEFFDAFFEPPTAIVWGEEYPPGGAQNGSGSRTQDSLKAWYYEFSHPLNSGDTAHDFALQVGSTVGFEVFWEDWSGASQTHHYLLLSSGDPEVCECYGDPNKYGDIVIAEPSPPSPATTGPVGGFVEPVNRLAVFAPYLALPALVAAVAVVVAAPWKKHER